MSTALQQERGATPPREDPFYLGWREVSRTMPDGRVVVERIPLTLEDLLHPQEGDVALTSSQHDIDRRYLADVFQQRLAGVEGAMVASDLGVYWDDPELDHHSPDVAVFFGVRSERQNWSSFSVAEEGVRPRLLVEIVSPKSRVNDVTTKVHEYHLARVPLYVIVDRETEEGPARVVGYQYTPQGYLPMPADARGRLWLEPLGIWIGTHDNRVVCYDGQTDQEIGDYVQVCAQLEAERTRLEEERQRAEAAENRARQLEAELRRLRGEAGDSAASPR